MSCPKMKINASYKSNLWTKKVGKGIPFIDKLHMQNIMNGMLSIKVVLIWTN